MNEQFRNKRTQEFRKAIRLMLDAQFDDLSVARPNEFSPMAQSISALAKKQNVNIAKDPELLKHISKLEIMGVVPENLYPAVTDILVKMYKLKEKTSTAS